MVIPSSIVKTEKDQKEIETNNSNGPWKIYTTHMCHDPDLYNNTEYVNNDGIIEFTNSDASNNILYIENKKTDTIISVTENRKIKMDGITEFSNNTIFNGIINCNNTLNVTTISNEILRTQRIYPNETTDVTIEGNLTVNGNFNKSGTDAVTTNIANSDIRNCKIFDSVIGRDASGTDQRKAGYFTNIDTNNLIINNDISINNDLIINNNIFLRNILDASYTYHDLSTTFDISINLFQSDITKIQINNIEDSNNNKFFIGISNYIFNIQPTDDKFIGFYIKNTRFASITSADSETTINDLNYYIYNITTSEYKTIDLNINGNFEYISIVNLNYNSLTGYTINNEFNEIFLYKHDIDLIDKLNTIDDNIINITSNGRSSTNINSNLHVTGQTDLRGDLTIDGVFTDGNYTFDTTGNVSGLGTVNCGAITCNGDLSATGTITGTTSIRLDSTTITTEELGVLDGVIPGIADPSKALVLDSNKDVGTIRNLTIDGVFTDGNYRFDTTGNVSGLGTVGCGTITSSGSITGTSLNLANGAITSGAITSSGSITGSSLNLANGTITSGAITGTSLNLSNGTITSGAITSSGSITGTSLNLANGAITASGAITGSSLNLANGTITSGAITSTGESSMQKLTVDSVVLDGTSITNGTATLNAGDLSGVTDLTLTGSIKGPSNLIIDPAAHGNNTGTLTIAGNLTVQGTTTTVNSTIVEISDNIIVLAKNQTGTAIANAGLEIERGDNTNVQFIWDEVNDRWSAGANGNLNFHAGLIGCGAITSTGDSSMDKLTVDSVVLDGTSITDGTATLNAGALSGVTTISCGAITSSGNLSVTGTITADTSITLDNTTITTAELGVLDGVIQGTAAASKALVLNATRDITNIRNLTIDGVLTVNDVMHAHVPRGVIVMWSGEASNIPLGWVLCDGSIHGSITTPNLSGKFIVGYSTSDTDYNTVSNTGGSKNFTITADNLPRHDHSCNVSQSESHSHPITGGSHSHPASSNQSGDHTHTIQSLEFIGSSSEGGNGTEGIAFDDQTHQTSTGNSSSWLHSSTLSQAQQHAHTITVQPTSHTHTIQQDGIHAHTVTIHQGGGVESPSSIDNRPPYYVLCYIMKT